MLAAAAAASVITVAVFLVQPRQYRAVADVVVPVPPQQGSRIAAVGQSVADFEGALRSSAVAQRVAAETGEPSDDVASGLASDQLFGGTVVEVAYTASDPEVAEDVAELASREALVVLLRAQLAPYEQQLAVAQAASDRLEGEYEAFLTRTGMLNPEQAFEVATKRLLVLQDRIGRAEANGDTEEARRLREIVEERQDRLVPDRVEFTFLQESRIRANMVLTEAEASFVAADAALEAAETGRSVESAQAVAVSRAAQLLRQLLVVVVLVTALVIGLIVLLELASAQERSARDRVALGTTPVVEGDGEAGSSERAAARRRRHSGRMVPRG